MHMASVTFLFRLLRNTVAATNLSITWPKGQLISSNRTGGKIGSLEKTTNPYVGFNHEVIQVLINTLRKGLLNCLNARSRGLNFRHRASCI